MHLLPEKTYDEDNTVFARMLQRKDALLHLAQAVRATGYQFITPTPATHNRVNCRPGNEWASTMEDVFGWSRPYRNNVLPARIHELMVKASAIIPHGEGWRSLVRLSSLNGQLFMHSAFPTTQADAVFFGPDTYRFAHAITEHLKNHPHPPSSRWRAVDIGCGAGPGAILTALACPQAEVLAVDINTSALVLTSINAALAGVANVVTLPSDVLEDVSGAFDLIMANPPYLMDDSERAYRHGGGALGAQLSLSILDAALQRLAPGGHLLLYTGVAIVHGQDPFYRAAQQRLTQDTAAWHWRYHEIDPDVFGEELERQAYSDTDRIAAVLLTVSKPV